MNNILKHLEKLIKNKKKNKINTKYNSYTLFLFNKGDDLILKKIGEELIEIIIAAKNFKNNKNNKNFNKLIYECSDLLYHFSVMLSYFNIKNKNLYLELKNREKKSGIQEKKDRLKK